MNNIKQMVHNDCVGFSNAGFSWNIFFDRFSRVFENCNAYCAPVLVDGKLYINKTQWGILTKL